MPEKTAENAPRLVLVGGTARTAHSRFVHFVLTVCPAPDRYQPVQVCVIRYVREGEGEGRGRREEGGGQPE